MPNSAAATLCNLLTTNTGSLLLISLLFSVTARWWINRDTKVHRETRAVRDIWLNIKLQDSDVKKLPVCPSGFTHLFMCCSNETLVRLNKLHELCTDHASEGDPTGMDTCKQLDFNICYWTFTLNKWQPMTSDVTPDWGHSPADQLPLLVTFQLSP